MEWQARRARAFALPALLSLGTACADRSATEPADPASARPAAAAGDLASTMGFRRAVTVDAIRVHQAALQAIADANGDRSALGAGHAASIEYVRQQMVAAGYTVTVQSFPVTHAGDVSTPVFRQISPFQRDFVRGVEFSSFSMSGSGDVTGVLAAVDLAFPTDPGTPSTSGCEAADFAGFPAGAVALMLRGSCNFEDKVKHATAAGASAAVIMNSGLPGMTGLYFGNLGDVPLAIPAVSTDFATGVMLATQPNATVRVSVDWQQITTSASNVIAELPVGNPGNVIVIGAPIDSRQGDAGINASSGATSMLEIARVFAAQEREARNRVRFVWFGASQLGNYGAEAYVAGLSAADVASIRAMVHLDRIGSPNFVRIVESGGAPGSAGVAAVFGNYFGGIGLASLSQPLQAASPGDPFSDLGIPTGGLFTGSTVLKTAEYAFIYGGTAGVAYDPCAIGTCDGINNVSLQALEQMSDAAAHGVLLLSKRNFAKNPLTPN